MNFFSSSGKSPSDLFSSFHHASKKDVGDHDNDNDTVHEMGVAASHINLTTTSSNSDYLKLEDYYEGLDKDETKRKPIHPVRFPHTYLVSHRASGERRALKILSKSKVSPDLFWAEVQIYKELYHPNVLHLYETLEDEEHWYLVKDRVDLPHIYRAIPQMFPNPQDFDEARVAVVIRTILKTLVYCHDKNVVHSDLSYQNILFDPHKKMLRSLVIVGFGYAQFKREQHRIYVHRSSRSTGEALEESSSDDDDESSSDSDENDSGVARVAKADLFAAPETRLGDLSVFGKAGDLWSVGMLAYQLLTKCHPFEEPGIWPIHFKDREWKQNHFASAPCMRQVSMEARDFIQSLLEYDPDDRPTAAQALEHDWLDLADHVGTKVHKEELAEALDNLHKYDATNKLEKAARMYIVSNLLHHKDRETLDKCFRYMDRARNNVITKDELRNAFIKVNNSNTGGAGGIGGSTRSTSSGRMAETEAQLEAAFDRLDVKKTGVIEYSEFLAAAADDSIVLTRENLWATFDQFDKSNTGAITVDDMKKIFNEGRKKKVFHKRDGKKLMKKYDSNGDGQINFEEFCEIMGCD